MIPIVPPARSSCYACGRGSSPLVQAVDSGSAAALPSAERETLVRWRALFAPKLAYVQSVRNSIAHGIAVSDTDLENTLEVARRLLSIPEAEGGSGAAASEPVESDHERTAAQHQS